MNCKISKRDLVGFVNFLGTRPYEWKRIGFVTIDRESGEFYEGMGEHPIDRETKDTWKRLYRQGLIKKPYKCIKTKVREGETVWISPEGNIYLAGKNDYNQNQRRVGKVDMRGDNMTSLNNIITNDLHGLVRKKE